MSTPEGAVKDKVKAWLKARGWWYYMPVQNGLGVSGIPDIIACRPLTITQDMVGQTIGVFVGIETKAPGRLSNLSEPQKLQLAGIAKAAGAAHVIDDVSMLEKHYV